MIRRSAVARGGNAVRTLGVLLLCCTPALAAQAPPTGRLPDAVRPTAYRLELSIDPAASEFGGHAEIDAILARPARTIFLHGRGLHMKRVLITRAGQAPVVAKYREVDSTGVAALDLPTELPAGTLTLSFEYTAGFRTSAEGLFHAEVAGDWYAWGRHSDCVGDAKYWIDGAAGVFCESGHQL